MPAIECFRERAFRPVFQEKCGGTWAAPKARRCFWRIWAVGLTQAAEPCFLREWCAPFAGWVSLRRRSPFGRLRKKGVLWRTCARWRPLCGKRPRLMPAAEYFRKRAFRPVFQEKCGAAAHGQPRRHAAVFGGYGRSAGLGRRSAAFQDRCPDILEALAARLPPCPAACLTVRTGVSRCRPYRLSL